MHLFIIWFNRLWLAGMLMLLPAVPAFADAVALTAPEQQVSRYYQAMSTRNTALFRSLYPPSERSRLTDALLSRRFSSVESVTVERWLGVQIDEDLAHVAVSVKVTSADDPLPEYSFAHHDFKRIGNDWYFVAVDGLPTVERIRVTVLWQRQKTHMKTEPELKEHVEWIQRQRQQAAQRRRARPVQLVAEE